MTRAEVNVPLEVLDSILSSALQAAVRHAATGASEGVRTVLWTRQGEIVGLAASKIHAALAASGYVTREGDTHGRSESTPPGP